MITNYLMKGKPMLNTRKTTVALVIAVLSLIGACYLIVEHSWPLWFAVILGMIVGGLWGMKMKIEIT